MQLKNTTSYLEFLFFSISEFGEAHFRFKSTSVPEILTVIKQNIQAAIKQRSNRTRNSDSFTIVQGNSSSLSNDQSFQTLLNRSKETQNNSIVSPVQKDYQQSINTCENSANSSEEYNSLETSVCRENGAQIISTVTVRKDNGTDIEVKLDQHGYSHVQLTENVKDECKELPNDKKARSISGCAVFDDEYNRSTSVCSCDSGIVTTDAINEDSIKKKHKSNNSFDSGVSTSSIKPEISASIGGIFIVTEQDSEIDHNSACSFVPYSQVIQDSSPSDIPKSTNVKGCDNGDYSSIYWDAEVTTKDEPKEVEKRENLYEDLDKYRKDLSKHLGFDPKINPTEVPPSLPDRPSTLPTRRKTRSKSTKKDKKITIQEMFKTVTRGRTGSMSSTSSNTSECDEDKSNTTTLSNRQQLPLPSLTTLSNRQQWPLPSSAISGCNELYTTVPDEGIFSSGRQRARSYEEKPSNTFMNDSIVSVNKWPMDFKSNSGLNNAILYDPIYSQVNRNNINGSKTCVNGSGMRRSLRRSNSSVDLMLHERSRLQQRAVDLLTGDDDTITKHSEILTPVLVSPLEHDFIDFSTEIKVPDLDINSVNTQQIDSHENSDSVWNPFPRIADFTSSVKSEHEDETEGDLVKLNESDPFDIFHIGVVSSRLGLSTHGSGLSFDSVTELSDLDKTIHDPNEDIYIDMGNQTLLQEQTVEYVLPTDVYRTNDFY